MTEDGVAEDIVIIGCQMRDLHADFLAVRDQEKIAFARQLFCAALRYPRCDQRFAGARNFAD